MKFLHFLSALLTGVLIAWSIGQGMDALSEPGGGFANAAPWLALALLIALAYGLGVTALARRRR